MGALLLMNEPLHSGAVGPNGSVSFATSTRIWNGMQVNKTKTPQAARLPKYNVRKSNFSGTSKMVAKYTNAPVLKLLIADTADTKHVKVYVFGIL